MAVPTSFNLTQSQLLLWTGQEMSPESPLYNVAMVFDIRGPIDPHIFQEAFQVLIQQSDVLRTVFHSQAGLPQQEILPELSYQMEVLSMEDEAAFRVWVSERNQRSFNLSQVNFDSVLVKISPERYFWYFNQHHLLTDAWAGGVLFRKMGALYHNLRQGSLDTVEPLPPYREFISYEQELRFKPKYAPYRLFWEQRAGELPVPPRLYGDKGRPDETRAERIFFELGKERSEKLRALAREKDLRALTEDMSLFNIFLTTLFAYVHKISGQKKLAIGTPAHNRLSPAFKQTAGVFIEFFPMLAEVEEGDSFQDLYKRVSTGSHEFLRNARPGTSSFRLSKQFNVVLNYIHAKFGDFHDIPTRVEWMHPGHCDPGHHLRLQVHDFNDTGSLSLNFDLNVSVFNSKLQSQVPQHFLSLLDAFMEDRSQTVAGVALVDSPTVLASFGEDTQPAFQNLTLIELFQQQVAETPHRPALELHEQVLTYQELNEQSAKLATFLKEKGVQTGDRVALFLTRSIEYMVGVMGVMKAGATYIPIPSDTPRERIKFILEDAEVSLLLHETFLETEGLEIPAIDLEGLSMLEELDEGSSVIVGTGSAYIMYTSGSTGTPKGVEISHAALSHYIQWAAATYTGTDPVTMPLFSKIGFDLTVTSQFVPLVSGGKIRIYPEVGVGADLAVLEVFKENRVNTVKLTPSHISLLKDIAMGGSQIQTVIVGGEDFPTQMAAELQQMLGPSVSIYNEYGPTEATVGCVVHRYNRDEDKAASVPIGLPIPGVEVYVLDREKQPLPSGVPGELYIAGRGLAEGYVNQAELTLKAFTHLEHAGGIRAYKSGDLVRINASGELEYLGRVDKQVKIGGIRIEPGEIEAILSQHPSISQAVVEVQQSVWHAHEGVIQYCTQCGLPSNYPDASYDEEGVCNLCNAFDSYQRQAQQYFRREEELMELFQEISSGKEGEYDCLLLLSGGKDSSYALARLVEMGLNVLAFTLDNGYISEQAKANIRRVVKTLGVDHVFAETSAMNEIFVDSLKRYSNVCNGCFKTIYTLSTQVALEKKIPYIVTGLSRGQFFETRLTEELFREQEVDVSKIDQTILETRKAYHRVNDAVCQLLDVSMFQDDQVFEKVKFLDFYRYTDVSLEEMMAYLKERLPWERPTDTGRSTNCLINQVGIYIHKKERGFNNYAFPYSWDVRIGHKTREEALYEINEPIEEREVQKILEEIGYTEVLEKFAAQKYLAAFYTTTQPVSEAELQAYLAEHLPASMIPARFYELDEVPLTANGKIDREQLRNWDLAEEATPNSPLILPETEVEEIVAEVWAEILKVNPIGINQDFLSLGGTSLAAIRIMARLNESLGLEIPLVAIFEQPTIEQLSQVIEERILEMMESV